MKPNDFSISIPVEISRDEAIKKIGEVPEWWGVAFSGSAQKQNDKFVIKMGGASFFDFTVTELIPGKKVVWLVTDCNMPWYTDKNEWTNTRLIFDLDENNGITELTFTHEGLTPDVECYKDCKPGWTHWINRSLLSYFTIGSGDFDQSGNFRAAIAVSKSPQDVFNCITNDVAKWWGGKDLEGSTKNLNDEFVIHHPGAHYSKQKLVEVVPGKKLIWLVTESTLYWLKKDQHEWTNTKMIFEISTRGDKTILRFTHEGLVPEKESYAMCEQGWNLIIKDYLFHFINDDKAHF